MEFTDGQRLASHDQLSPLPRAKQAPATTLTEAPSFRIKFTRSVKTIASNAFQRGPSDPFTVSEATQEQEAAFAEDEAFRRSILGEVTEKQALFEENQNIITEAWMVHPESAFRRIWNLSTVFLVITLLFWIPFDLGFNYTGSNIDSAVLHFWLGLDWFIDIFFVLDILLNFRTAVVDDGELIQKPSLVRRRYIRGFFWLDLIATIPYDRFVALGLSSGSRAAVVAKLPRLLRFLRLLRLMRLLRVMKMRRILDQWESLGTFANWAWRVLKIVFWIASVGHVLGCAWFFLADISGLGNDTWAGTFALGASDATFTDKYTTAVYWAFVTVTTIGYGDVVPVSNDERQFVIICTFIGNLVFAFMIGKFTAMASRVDASGQVYQAKLDEVDEFMRFHALPKALRKRVRGFYERYWSHSVYFNEQRVLSELSFSLRRDVDFYLKREIITKVPFFQDADANFVAAVVNNLEERYCGPDETIIELGEIGHEMYILKRGEVVVIAATGAPSHHLGDGAFFGEVALLDPSLRRTASIRSVTACELYSLSAAAMEQVLNEFPDFREAMLAVAEIRLAQTQLTTGMLTAAAQDAIAGTPHAQNLLRSGSSFGNVDSIVQATMEQDSKTPLSRDDSRGKRQGLRGMVGSLTQAPDAVNRSRSNSSYSFDSHFGTRSNISPVSAGGVTKVSKDLLPPDSMAGPRSRKLKLGKSRTSKDGLPPQRSISRQRSREIGKSRTSLAARRRQHGRGSLVGSLISKDLDRLAAAQAQGGEAGPLQAVVMPSSKEEEEGLGGGVSADEQEGVHVAAEAVDDAGAEGGGQVDMSDHRGQSSAKVSPASAGDGSDLVRDVSSTTVAAAGALSGAAADGAGFAVVSSPSPQGSEPPGLAVPSPIRMALPGAALSLSTRDMQPTPGTVESNAMFNRPKPQAEPLRKRKVLGASFTTKVAAMSQASARGQGLLGSSQPSSAAAPAPSFQRKVAAMKHRSERGGLSIPDPNEKAFTVPTSRQTPTSQKFRRKAKELLLKYRVAKAMGMTKQNRYEQVRSQYDRTVLGKDDGAPPVSGLRTVGQRIELLETAMMDIASKMDALLVVHNVDHPAIRKPVRREHQDSIAEVNEDLLSPNESEDEAVEKIG